MTPILALILPALVIFSPAFALWPLPKDLQTGSKALRLADNFDIQLSVQGAPADLKAAVTRTKGYLKTDKLQRLIVGRGENDRAAIKSAKELSSLTVSLTSSGTVRSISEEAMDALEDRIEGYSLTVPGDGSAASLKANSTLGLFRGLTTFGQLWYEFDDITYTLEAPIQIKDAPAYVCFRILMSSPTLRLMWWCSPTVDSC
jgi:hexosaminidase